MELCTFIVSVMLGFFLCIFSIHTRAVALFVIRSSCVVYVTFYSTETYHRIRCSLFLLLMLLLLYSICLQNMWIRVIFFTYVCIDAWNWRSTVENPTTNMCEMQPLITFEVSKFQNGIYNIIGAVRVTSRHLPFGKFQRKNNNNNNVLYVWVYDKMLWQRSARCEQKFLCCCIQSIRFGGYAFDSFTMHQLNIFFHLFGIVCCCVEFQIDIHELKSNRTMSTYD